MSGYIFCTSSSEHLRERVANADELLCRLGRVEDGELKRVKLALRI